MSIKSSRKSLKPTYHKSTFSKEDKFYSSLDRASFGAPRECFNNVVGPNKFNYMPFKPSEPGPGNNGGGLNPYKEIGK